MRGVDLRTYVFDYDLTFAALLMHSDGHIYHQYGNRVPEAPDSHLSMASLARVMRGTLEDHATRNTMLGAEATRPPPPREAGHAVEDLPTMARRVKAGKAPDCFHCHMVFQARDEDAIEKATFDAGVAWRWPAATRLGLHLDRDDQQLVLAVAEESPAAAAGIKNGDRLSRIGDRDVATEGDVQWVLHDLPAQGADVHVSLVRDRTPQSVVVRLKDGWRVGSPEELWRATMWRLDPRPGFGGPMLSSEEKEQRGIDADVCAFRVQYIVTWGDHSRIGRNAQTVGLRKNDIVLSAAGKSDFRSPQHFHAWFRLTRTVGEIVPLEILRKGEKQTIELPVIE